MAGMIKHSWIHNITDINTYVLGIVEAQFRVSAGKQKLSNHTKSRRIRILISVPVESLYYRPLVAIFASLVCLFSVRRARGGAASHSMRRLQCACFKAQTSHNLVADADMYTSHAPEGFQRKL